MPVHRCTLGLLTLVLVSLASPLPATWGQTTPAATSPAADRGERVLDKPTLTHGRQWALIIGINYKGKDTRDGPDFRLELENAEKDAEAVYQLLKDHYGFKDRGEAKDNENVISFLCGKEASKANILKYLDSEFLASKEVARDDSVLVYFAGHGDRLTDNPNDPALAPGDRGLIYPYDVEFKEKKPKLPSVLRLQSELVTYLRQSPALHKLLILDSCHSGEVFTSSAAPRREHDTGGHLDRLKQASFQAIASCLAVQVSSDGRRDMHSPFTAAFLKALRTLPTRPGKKDLVTADDIFWYMRPEILDMPKGQSPDCRQLFDTEGEFPFFPTGDFSPFLATSVDFDLLRALVPGEYGNWWFEEVPWLMPSLRYRILVQAKQDHADIGLRNPFSDALNKSDLTVTVARLLSNPAVMHTEDRLQQMRLEHLRKLFRAEDDPGFRESLRKVADELKKWHSARSEGPGAATERLTGMDLHFLAVLEQYLGDAEAGDTYAEALSWYEAQPRQGDQAELMRAMASLCLADFGYYHLEVARNPAAAASLFQQARQVLAETAASTSPAAAPAGAAAGGLELNGLMKRGQAALNEKHFDEAVQIFAEAAKRQPKDEAIARALHDAEAARHVATDPIPPPFKIFTLCREADAWLRLGCWGEADERLEVAIHVAENMDPDAPLTAHAYARQGWAYLEQWRLAAAQQSFSRSNAILKDKQEYGARLLQFQNAHGLALAARYQGHPDEALQQYRQLANDISRAFGDLRTSRGLQENFQEVKDRLTERWVSVQERLGDCNLFGDWRTQDLKEAVDDYRRGIRACYVLPPHRRDPMKVTLLYKECLALALPSEVQDLELAAGYLQDADTLSAKLQDPKAQLEVELLHKLTGLVLALCQCTQGKSEATVDRNKILEQLRQAIRESRNDLVHNIQRDRQELLMLTCRLLVQQDLPADRYHTLEDAEMLVGLCRKALQAKSGDALAYLRPYYDAVVEAKLQGKPRHVKDLLETVWEATRGESFRKPREARPVLAVYFLGDRGYLFLDLPQSLGGTSKVYPLEDGWRTTDLVAALEGKRSLLSLPRELEKDLARMVIDRQQRREPATSPNGGATAVALPETSATTLDLEVWCTDSVNNLRRPEDLLAAAPPADVHGFPPKPVLFPFRLPAGVNPKVPEKGTSVDPIKPVAQNPPRETPELPVVERP